VDSGLVTAATAAATTLARHHGVPVADAVVVHNSNAVGLRLVPGDVFARTALVGKEVAAFEVRIARGLAAAHAPVASLDPRFEPRVYELDGFAITFWTYVRPKAQPVAASEYATALEQLHSAMRGIDAGEPHFSRRIDEAEQLLLRRDETPGLDENDRAVLLDALRAAHRAVRSYGAAEQLLHGEPHPGNLLATADGPVFIDFETCCRGPVEFDVAHAPTEVAMHYPRINHALVHECRRLILVMVAAWRFDARDQFPDGRRHGRRLVEVLRAGPPWPAVGALSG
jgi:hypothetical protein